jgi:tetratricopeptide (TPR) repeat protein
MLRGLVSLCLVLATAPASADPATDCDKGSGDVAIAGCTELIRSNPRDAVHYYNRGNAYHSKGEFDRAIADWSEALRLDPLGDQDLAIADYSKAIELNPKSGEPYANRGNAYRIKGEDDRAITDYSKAIELRKMP